MRSQLFIGDNVSPKDLTNFPKPPVYKYQWITVLWYTMFL